MTLPLDYEGGPQEKAKSGDGGIVGPAGQGHRGAAKPGSEQIAAWGGFTEAETEVNETGERAVPMRIVERGLPEGS